MSKYSKLSDRISFTHKPAQFQTVSIQDDVKEIVAFALNHATKFSPYYKTATRARPETPMPHLDGLLRQLINDLQDQFSEEFYVERPEEEEVSRSSTVEHIVFVRGLLGVGKTCLLRQSTDRISRLFPSSKVFYFDLQPPSALEDDVSHFRKFTLEESFQEARRALEEIYSCIESHLIDEKNKTLWYEFRIMEHPDLIARKNLLLHLNQSLDKYEPSWTSIRRIDTTTQLHHFLNSSPQALTYVDAAFSECQVSTSLNTLIRFSLEIDEIRIVLILDNIDRYDIYIQQLIIDEVIRLEKILNLTIVVALREVNFKRLQTSSSHDTYQTTVMIQSRVESIEQIEDENLFSQLFAADIENKESPSNQQSSRRKKSRKRKIKVANTPRILRDIFFKRQVLVRKHLASMLEASGITRYDEAEINELVCKVCSLLGLLANELLGVGYYELANHSIRHVLSKLSITSMEMMTGSEAWFLNELSLSSLVSAPTQSHRECDDCPFEYGFHFDSSRSKRNSYSIKMLLDAGNHVPKFIDGLPQPFNTHSPEPLSFDLLVLDAMLCCVGRDPRSNSTYPYIISKQELSAALKDSHLMEGIQKRDRTKMLNKSLSRLESRSNIFPELGLIQTYNMKIENRRKAYIVILPSACFLMSKLLLTCEYLFWAILNLEFEKTVCNSFYRKTLDAITERFGNEYIDQLLDHEQLNYFSIAKSNVFKLEVVLFYFETIFFRKMLDWKASRFDKNDSGNWSDYMNKACYGKVIYPIRVFNSLASWLEHAELYGQREHYSNRISKLRRDYHAEFGGLQKFTIEAIVD